MSKTQFDKYMEHIIKACEDFQDDSKNVFNKNNVKIKNGELHKYYDKDNIEQTIFTWAKYITTTGTRMHITYTQQKYILNILEVLSNAKPYSKDHDLYSNNDITTFNTSLESLKKEEANAKILYKKYFETNNRSINNSRSRNRFSSSNRSTSKNRK